MPRLVLIAKNAYVWLDQLSKRYGREIRTLDAVPDEELAAIARRGITGLWLIGLWQRSRASEKIKRWRGNTDAVASAYSLDDYKIAAPGDRVLRANSGLRVTTSPVWIKRDVSLLASFGELLYRDVVLVAAYPMTVFSTPCDFVIYRELPSRTVAEGRDTELRIGRVTPEDLTRWR